MKIAPVSMRFQLGKLSLLLAAIAAVSAHNLLAQTPGATRIAVKVGEVPVAGALVALLDSADRPIVERMTTWSGRVSFNAAPGHYRVRVRRIGYAPFFVSSIEVPAKEEIAIAVPNKRIELSAVVVTAGTSCTKSAMDSRNIGVVWEEISKALRGTQLTRQDLAIAGDARVYSKEVQYDGVVVSMDTSRIRLAGAKPFAAVAPSWLASRGYVHGDVRSGWEYFAPDEAVLLSPSFADTHCFRIVRDRKRSGEVGLSFQPAPRRHIADIAGTLWLDENSSELHEMDFHFVNAGVVDRFKPGGRVHFRRTKSGAWLVDDWMLRFPSLQQRIGPAESLVEIGYKENGGSIVAASLGEPVAHSGFARLRGNVFDSLSVGPLSGATIIAGNARTLSANDGSFLLYSVPLGQQVIGLQHPSLDALGYLSIERTTNIDAGENVIELATPSVATIWLRLCKNVDDTTPIAERGIVHGFVRDELNNPVQGASVVFRWIPYAPLPTTSTYVARLTLTVTTDSKGHYTACGFRRMSLGNVTASASQVRSQPASFNFKSTLLIRRDLVVSRASILAKRNGESIPVLLRDQNGDPIPFAYVVASDSESFRITNTKGEFHTAHVADAIRFQARRIGFSPIDTTVDVSNAAVVTLVMERIKNVLDTVVVHADAPGYDEYLDRHGFYRRKAKTVDGTFITEDAIGRRNPSDLTGMLSDVAGVRVAAGSGRGGKQNYVLGRGGLCALGLVLDGQVVGTNAPGDVRLRPRIPAIIGGAVVSATQKKVAESTASIDELVPVSMVAAIEVYPSASSVPNEFQQFVDGCGLIVVWTKF